ncbi:uncharacterized membrane protein YraQ (UPF0718 family) [Methanococcus voltae]|uniref:Uncharacterized membrane protein YraQ (UPF0718 family) n=1 Tax=Methanococcus voltae TaxID=2188 RepID=A0A8J7UT04_METVO|nr:permease [Methanococcus voltae]MBP2201174.1 uncharacterized membrane protein YraQ (UPF0718 family) [Methanococcus voltae]
MNLISLNFDNISYIILKSFEKSFNFLKDSILYILVGFIISAYLKVKLKGDLRKKIVHNLNYSSFSLLKSSLMGAILPLCSASGVPVANAMNSKGVNMGTSMAFIISAASITPIGFFMTLSIIGYKLAIYQVILSIILSICVGIVFLKDKYTPYFKEGKQKEHNFTSILLSQLKFIMPSILIGYMLSGLFATLIPTEVIVMLLSNNLITYFVISAIRLVIFLCPYALIPLINNFAIEGIPKGIILSFLISAPATGLPMILALNKCYGLKKTLKYLISIIVISAILGLLSDTFIF